MIELVDHHRRFIRVGRVRRWFVLGSVEAFFFLTRVHASVASRMRPLALASPSFIVRVALWRLRTHSTAADGACGLFDLAVQTFQLLVLELGSEELAELVLGRLAAKRRRCRVNEAECGAAGLGVESKDCLLCFLDSDQVNEANGFVSDERESAALDVNILALDIIADLGGVRVGGQVAQHDGDELERI